MYDLFAADDRLAGAPVGVSTFFGGTGSGVIQRPGVQRVHPAHRTSRNSKKGIIKGSGSIMFSPVTLIIAAVVVYALLKR